MSQFLVIMVGEDEDGMYSAHDTELAYSLEEGMEIFTQISSDPTVMQASLLDLSKGGVETVMVSNRIEDRIIVELFD
jgi:hypothetical protein